MNSGNQPRQIIQIAAATSIYGCNREIEGNAELYALANDGTLWLCHHNDKKGFYWVGLPALPQPKTEKAKMKEAILGIAYGINPQPEA